MIRTTILYYEKWMLAKERIRTLENLLNHYRADFAASFNEVKRLRKIIQDDA